MVSEAALLESVASPPISPMPATSPLPVLSVGTSVGVDGLGDNRPATAGPCIGVSVEEVADCRAIGLREPCASTPSPDRDGFNLNSEERVESPHPAAVQRSIQSTPEPTHYYGANLGIGGQPISTPSPNVSSMSATAQAGYLLGMHPRFPPGATSLAGPPVLPSLSSSFPVGLPSSTLTMPPPLPSPTTGVLPPANTLAPGGLPGYLHGMQANPQAAFHHHAFLSAGMRPPMGAAGWRMPSCPVPMGYPALPPHPDLGAHMAAAAAAAGVGASNPLALDPLRPPFLPAPHPGAAGSGGLLPQAKPTTPGVSPIVPMGSLGPGMPELDSVPGCTPSGIGCAGGGAAISCGTGAAVPPTAPCSACSTAAAAAAIALDGTSGGGVMGTAPVGALGVASTSEGGVKASNSAKVSSAGDGIAVASDGVASVPPEAMELRGHVVKLCQTQAGSKHLQRQLLKGHAGVVDVILSEVEKDIATLMCDAYGNYLCSVCFQACSVRQRKRMLEKLAPCIFSIACDKRGTHALQALIGLLTTPDEQELLLQAIKDHVIKLCMDPNGTHVVQRLLYCFVPPSTDWIYTPVVKNLVEVAHHPYGLCVLKKCISQAKPPGKHQQSLLDQLARNALDLVQSPYGNYAVQHALEEWGGDCCLPIFESLEGRMMQLSIQKFSSNVVEKIFCAAPREMRRRLIDELIVSAPSARSRGPSLRLPQESDKMTILVNSNYGHYVVKRALQLAEPAQVQALMEAIKGNLSQLPNRRLRATWEKVMSSGSKRLSSTGADGQHGSASAPATS